MLRSFLLKDVARASAGFRHVQLRGMHNRNKTTMEFIAKGWSALKEVDRVIDYCEPIKNLLFSPLKHHSSYNAHHVFDKSPQRNFSSLTISELLSNYPHCIDEDAMAIAIKACRGDLKPGSVLHSFAVSSGFIRYRPVSNSLMSMYCKSGLFERAFVIFDSLDDPDIVSFNTILKGYQNADDALRFAARMNANGVVFDPVTYTTALSSCLDDVGYVFGFQLHCKIVKSGLDVEVFVGNTLITLYWRWGRVNEAEKVFSEMPSKDSISWNAMLSGYSKGGDYGLETIWTFREMLRLGIMIDNVSIASVLSTCAEGRNSEIGRLIHGLSIKTGYGRHHSVCNLLMSAYGKCDSNEYVKLVFMDMAERDVVSWTTMITNHPEDAIPLFCQMRMDGVYPNDVTFIGVLHAVTQRNSVNEGLMIHGFCLRTGFVSELNVSNTLVTMYAKFESMEAAGKVFEDLQYRDTISWNALISGYQQNRLYQEALEAFRLAVMETEPNQYTFGSVLRAIGSAEAISLRHGQRCHSHLLKLGLYTNPILSSALLDMYAKRGRLSESKRIFEESIERTQFGWTGIISAHASHGDCESVMKIFDEMAEEGVRPDFITFLSMLTACGRKGMVDMGRQIWDSMVKDNVSEPSPEHYACMVDMLGRAGRLKEAEEFLLQIPGGPSFSALQSLLGACRTHGDMEMGRRISNALIELQPEESGSYVLMSNLYAEKGDWGKVATLRRKMRDSKVRKEIGLSWVDIGGTSGSWKTHGFSSGDTSHPNAKEIRDMAWSLGQEMKFLEREGLQRSLVDIYTFL